jgi:putative FmdB family regulatory protein
MPLYAYTCQQCDHSFEALVFDGDEVHCPQCQGQELAKQWGVPARPRTASTALPLPCQSDGPPCGPVCSRFKA